MNKLFFLCCFALLSISVVVDNGFEFAERPFGDLQNGNAKCDDAESLSKYDLLSFREVPPSRKCYIYYSTERSFVTKPDGVRKLSGTRVTVTSEKYMSEKQAKSRWFISSAVNDPELKAGRSVINRGDNALIQWISGSYFIEIFTSGDELGDVNDIVQHYIKNYPPTYTISKEDIDPQRINLNTLSKHMKIIREAETYRKDDYDKTIKYAAIMAQCKEETTIRSASGLCKSAYINNPNEDQMASSNKLIGCPITMNFKESKRKALWVELEKKAQKADKLEFRPKEWECHYVGPQWYAPGLLSDLKFTKEELLALYKTDFPKEFLPDSSQFLMMTLKPSEE